MSSTEPPPPPGDVPPPSGGTTPPPPPAPDPYASAAPPPPPPPPTGQYGAGQYGAPAPGAPAAPGAGPGQPGSLLDRFLAFLLDAIIVVIPVVIINLVLASISDSWLTANLLTAVIDAAAFLGYFSYLESNRGQTIGKSVMKLRVFGPDGQSNPTMEQAVRRNIWAGFGILNVIPVLGPIVGFVLGIVALVLLIVGINSDPRRQHWFDKFAGGTQVLKIG